MTNAILGVLICGSIISLAQALQCYRCHSDLPGCGKELNIRLQRWHDCPDSAENGGENFCVKKITTVGARVTILRECLFRLRQTTNERELLPNIQRHNYCEYGRFNDPSFPLDTQIMYCFCNDYNGCNEGADVIWAGARATGLAMSLLASLYLLFVAR